MKLRLLHIKPEAGGATTYVFEPLQAVNWIAGQSIRLELAGLYGTHERRFSISSAPYEKDIHITTRISNSDFKQLLHKLKVGSGIDGHNIEGDFVWHNARAPKIWAANGIGITAFFSILKQADHDEVPLELTLLYTNKNDDFIFQKELDALNARHPRLHIIYMPNKRMSAHLIAAHTANITQSMVYLSGSSDMVDEVGSNLLSMGLPESSLMQDWFTGRFGWDEAEAKI